MQIHLKDGFGTEAIEHHDTCPTSIADELCIVMREQDVIGFEDHDVGNDPEPDRYWSTGEVFLNLHYLFLGISMEIHDCSSVVYRLYIGDGVMMTNM